ncbi:ABC transporter substrate-binding protein [Amycolatopsis mediterranei S699]|uniref:ABC transport system substrate-binding protein n=2 Tax=Amycolatopsis mediterranei TaxID=33910 RepID=A0A0H3CZS2_AMYMU|nr:MCE family protein [Amycolatopsis mediterranei]ADJ43590.1 ABC transport system substrate-binding protein [Amycolatopsis mediterranei U32]AEK40296.1 ABC transporter substrate-binding protein [Amycolatopsis mediterranei S699]AFO75302.1 ABC transporter substrate-binding protein [Amycolatopsis mediterranei S699]AGT82431.1 ABC transporter substrate-binding protein [Amycolatopsis mediterranei RB]KDO03789.1 ABC transporter substrate-binding protein [Amycolatopsis mediterranei]
MRRETRRKAGVRTAGVLFLVVMGVLVTLSIKVYDKDFVTTVPVTLKASRIGNQLSPGGQVKARGVLVGEIRGVRATPQGAEIALALEPGKVDMLPRNVSALLVPKTLFGERYVQLSIPDGERAPHLAAGDVIEQDHSANAVELERVFDNLLPLLKAVQPQKLATTLTAVSTALEGRGEQLGKTLSTAADYLKEFNPELPQLTSDLKDLAGVSRLYGDIAPDLLDALTDSAVTLNTVKEKQADLAGVYQQVTSSSQEVATFLAGNRDNLISLAADSRAPLEIAAKYSPSFACTIGSLNALRKSMDKVLGAGTREPGMHADVAVVPDSGKYLPGRDDPRFTGGGEPRCYPSGVSPTIGTAAAAPGTAGHPLLAGGQGDLGIANSPQEEQLLSTLVAPSIGVPTAEVPAWSSVLVGPLYRGTEVTLK